MVIPIANTVTIPRKIFDWKKEGFSLILQLQFISFLVFSFLYQVKLNIKMVKTTRYGLNGFNQESVDAIPEAPKMNAKIGVIQQSDDAIAVNKLVPISFVFLFILILKLVSISYGF